jgi:hypothetical protein
MSQNDDQVGYGRPPKHSQFKPGQSGNPSGRKPVSTFEADLLDELNGEVAIRENGVERKISKQRAIVNALVAAAIRGNFRASSTLLAILARSSPPRADQDLEQRSDADDDLVNAFHRRRRQSRASEPTPSKKPSEGR